MKYFMHNKTEVPFKLAKTVRKYFSSINTISTEVIIENKKYNAIIDVDSFLLLTNFDCFNCLTNCCVQFPYEFNERSREVIIEHLEEYDNLTKAVSTLKEKGLSHSKIVNSIKNDAMLIPDEHVKTTFDRCTCSCTHGDMKLCAIHKICIDKGMSLGEIIDTKPLWCSIYPLEIMVENDSSTLYIFVPNEDNEDMAMNDTNFPCMNVELSKSSHFRRDNPNGFDEDNYEPFILSYYSVLKYILGDKFIEDMIKELDFLELKEDELQYNKKI